MSIINSIKSGFHYARAYTGSPEFSKDLKKHWKGLAILGAEAGLGCCFASSKLTVAGFVLVATASGALHLSFRSTDKIQKEEDFEVTFPDFCHLVRF